MKNRQKIITTVLDILLLVGAFTAVLTINVRQWVTSAAVNRPDVLPRYEALTGPVIFPSGSVTASDAARKPAVCPVLTPGRSDTSRINPSVASYDLWRDCSRFAR